MAGWPSFIVCVGAAVLLAGRSGKSFVKNSTPGQYKRRADDAFGKILRLPVSLPAGLLILHDQAFVGAVLP